MNIKYIPLQEYLCNLMAKTFDVLNYQSLLQKLN